MKVFGVFGVDAAFDGVAANLDVFLLVHDSFSPAATRICSPCTRSDAGDALGNGMLHLDARVHFDEEELGVLVVQEFKRAGATIADVGLQASTATRSLDRPARCSAVMPRCRRLLDRLSGGAAASLQSRSPRHGPHCRAGRPSPGFRCGAAAPGTSRGTRWSSPNAVCASVRVTLTECVAERGLRCARRACRVPRLRQQALMMTGIANFRAQFRDQVFGRRCRARGHPSPARRARLPACMALIAETLSPMRRMVSAPRADER
jgi:hypothetical protein